MSNQLFVIMKKGKVERTLTRDEIEKTTIDGQVVTLTSFLTKRRSLGGQVLFEIPEGASRKFKKGLPWPEHLTNSPKRSRRRRRK